MDEDIEAQGSGSNSMAEPDLELSHLSYSLND